MSNGNISSPIDNNVRPVINYYYYSLIKVYVEISYIKTSVNNSCTLHDIMQILVLYRNMHYLTDLGVEHRFIITLVINDNCIVVVGSLCVYLQMENGIQFLMIKYWNGARVKVSQVKSRLTGYCTFTNYNIHFYMYILYINAFYFRPYNRIINLNNAVKYEAKLIMQWIFKMYIPSYTFSVTECEHIYRTIPVSRKNIFKCMCIVYNTCIIMYCILIRLLYHLMMWYLYLLLDLFIRLYNIHVHVTVFTSIESRYYSGGNLNSQLYSTHLSLMRTYRKYG